MGKRLNVKQMVQKKYTLIDGLNEDMQALLGQLEDSFTAIIYGGSGHGKTNFLVKLMKELKTVGDMLYVSYEEAHGKTIQDLILRHKLDEELPNLKFSDGETIGELTSMLRKKRSPKLIVLDSWQFSGLTLDDYKLLKKEFVFGKSVGKRKIFLIISHVNGKMPDGKTAIDIKKDCNIKIRVEGFVAFVDTSRYGNTKQTMVVYEERAQQYWGKKYTKLTGEKMTRSKRVTKAVIESSTTLHVLPKETDQEKDEALLNQLKATA